MVLTKSNLRQLKNGTVSVDEFDPTIRDAILVTRALGIAYIWVDALCIFQEDNGKDWKEQALEMNKIFGGSVLTLIVADSDSVMNGFLKKRDLDYIAIPRSGDEAIPANVFLSPTWDKANDDSKGAWSTRGWTMQEGLLANRLLHFTSSQIIWNCCEERKFERGCTESVQDVVNEQMARFDDASFGSGWIWKLDNFTAFKRLPDYLPISPDPGSLPAREIFRMWDNLVKNYTERKFRYSSDRLIAISGLANIFSKIIRSQEYAAGLWKLDMVRGLLWHVQGARLIPRISGESIRVKNRYFPSWSWAGIGHERVNFSQESNDYFLPLSWIEDVSIELDNPLQPFGAVSKGSITITGPLKKIPRIYNHSWHSAEAPMSELERHLSEIAEKETFGKVDPRYSAPPPGIQFAVLQMTGEVHGKLGLFVLESSGGVSNGHDEYHRVGVIGLQSVHRRAIASPRLLDQLAKLDDSLAARLGPREHRVAKRKTSNAVVAELRRESWEIETLVIV